MLCRPSLQNTNNGSDEPVMGTGRAKFRFCNPQEAGRSCLGLACPQERGSGVLPAAEPKGPFLQAQR